MAIKPLGKSFLAIKGQHYWYTVFYPWIQPWVQDKVTRSCHLRTACRLKAQGSAPEKVSRSITQDFPIQQGILTQSLYSKTLAQFIQHISCPPSPFSDGVNVESDVGTVIVTLQLSNAGLQLWHLLKVTCFLQWKWRTSAGLFRTKLQIMWSLET